MSLFKKASLFLFSLPIMGCTTVPTTTQDEHLQNYVPKITKADFNYDPMQTPIAKCYDKELKSKKI